jgi:hypothetical protein
LPERRRRIDWAAIAARARLHPNTWTQAAMMNRNNAAHIRSGRIRHFQPADEWAARYERSDTPGLVLVYVMYLGKKP